MGLESRLRLMMKMSFGGDVSQEVGYVGEAWSLGTDAARERNLLGRRRV